MEILLVIVRYVFVMTVFVGGGLVLWAIVRLAWEKSRPQGPSEDHA
jgi:uncharacterized membrane protein